MLHLNKRSCIVTNLIGIQWFTRESVVSRHGMARGITKYWIEGTSVSGMQRWMKAQTGRRYFSLFSPSFSRWNAYSLARSRSVYVSTLRLSMQVQKHDFFLCFFLLRGYIYRHSARHRVQFLSRRYHKVLVNCMTSSEVTTSTLKAHLQCAFYVLPLAFCLLPFYLSVPCFISVLSSEGKSWRTPKETRNTR